MAKATLALAARLGIEFLWLRKQAPELNATDRLWRELKCLVAANRQAETIDALAAEATAWTLGLRPKEARTKAGMRSTPLRLAKVTKYSWLEVIFERPAAG